MNAMHYVVDDALKAQPDVLMNKEKRNGEKKPEIVKRLAHTDRLQTRCEKDEEIQSNEKEKSLNITCVIHSVS